MYPLRGALYFLVGEAGGDVGRHFGEHSAINQAAATKYYGRPPRLSIVKYMYPFELTRSITIIVFHTDYGSNNIACM